MFRRKRMYSRRRRINYKRVLLIIIVLIGLVLLLSRVFRKNSYIDKINEALNSEITTIRGSMNIVSKIDGNVYENDGIRYTNQHQGIERLGKFDNSLPEDQNRVRDVKKLLENLVESADIQDEEGVEDIESLEELPEKTEGYYWLEVDIMSEDRVLLVKKEKEYNFDLYYNIEEKTVYLKEKYFDEFSEDYNKTNFIGYKANDEFVRTISLIFP